MNNIILRGVKQGNLQNLSLEIPRGKFIVFTGLSGSGKSTLAIDVIFQECQRQYLEALGMQGIHKPDIESIRNLSPAIMISQTAANKNPRSTVGTVTDMYTDLRMVYEKLGVRACPSCGEVISAADCKEEVEKVDGKFTVYMDCHHCHIRMEKLTRSHFSYNTKEGACPACEGLGRALTINKERTVNTSLSLEEGAVDFWEQKYKEYQIACLYQAFRHYGVPIEPNTPVDQFNELQKAILYDGVESEAVRKACPDQAPPKTVVAGKFEGVFTTLWRRMAEKGGEGKQSGSYFDEAVCPACHGERLHHMSRQVTVEGIRLPMLSSLSLDELLEWIDKLEAALSGTMERLVSYYVTDLRTKIQRIVNVGLGYLTLDRQTISLSGGEAQRVKLSATLDSDLTGIIYLLDEPTVGLHPKDTAGIITILERLRDLGNTVIVIEHDTDVMQAADHIIDIGPGAGKHGGRIVGQGTLTEMMSQQTSVTGQYLKRQEHARMEMAVRPGTGQFIEVKQAARYNLKNLDVQIPIGCFVAVTGVSGSGKSTLVFDVLAAGEAGATKHDDKHVVSGLAHFDQIVTIEQSPITRMKRSNVATYTDVYTEIRKIFGGLQEAKAQGLSAKHFSFNTPGGRCENCEGLGYVMSNMLFFQDMEVICPTCGGKQFNDEVLAIKYQGASIKDVLQLSVEEALITFQQHRKIIRILLLLQDVGLGYLELGQTLTTLSGGEGQRLKLAKELVNNSGKQMLYLMDEPTSGLHPVDVDNFLALLNRMVEAGNTVIVVEHNVQVIERSDWIIDLGPEGGHLGGQVVFTGTPLDMMQNGTSHTAMHLRKQG